MNLFSTLCLEITAACNRKCKFCPVAYNSRPDERMDEALVVKAFEELGQLGYKGRIEFYLYNEPMKDLEYLHWCIALARKHVPASCLMVATNGDYIRTVDQILHLYKLGLNQLLVNCYSPGLFQRRSAWLKELAPVVSFTDSVYLRLSPTKKVFQLLDKSDPNQFGTGVFRLMNRAGNIGSYMPPLKTPVKRMCVKPFRLLNVNWKGEALVCCQDYHGEMSYGSLADSSLQALWVHPVMNEYRRRLLLKDRSLPLCRGCDCYAGAYSHNVSAPAPPYATAQDIEALHKAKGG